MQRGFDNCVFANLHIFRFQPDWLINREIRVREIRVRRTNRVEISLGNSRKPIWTKIQLSPKKRLRWIVK